MQRAQVMGHAPINSLLLRFTGPSIVMMLVMGSDNVVDAIFVGRLGSEAIAALTVSFPFMMLFVAVGVGTGVGATSVISRYLGAGERLGGYSGGDGPATKRALLALEGVSLERGGAG